MKRKIVLLLTIAVVALSGCQNKTKPEGSQTPVATPNSDPYGVIKAQKNPEGLDKKGTVTQTMNAGGYTYVETADDKGQKEWLALPATKVAVGDKIEYSETPPMPNFKSKILKKSFDKIYFVPGIKVEK
ncbi:MAG: hypothetical protein PHR66_11510 [Desulfuromonadaceae bacterium]|nr:hypothetical protein [Desulfuromonadaceae bacterium]